MRGFWLSGLMALGLSACGHIPGYYPDDEAPRAAAAPSGPKSPPAPPPSARRPAQDFDEPNEAGESDDETDGEAEADEAEPADEAPPYVPPPRPPRYTPPSTWEPPATPPTAPAPQPVQPAPQPTRVAPPPREADAPADGVKTIRLDADTYYLVDARRNLCFLRHKESMTAVDCSRVVDPADPKASPAPTSPRAVPAPAAPTPPPGPSRVEPAPAPATPTPDETTRFEAAFTDIFCDRKARDETAPEARIRARGLSVERYEAIEGWWAGDENAWFALTSKAARSCRR